MIKDFLYGVGFVLGELIFYMVAFWLIFSIATISVDVPAIPICAFVTYIVRKFWVDWRNHNEKI